MEDENKKYLINDYIDKITNNLDFFYVLIKKQTRKKTLSDNIISKILCRACFNETFFDSNKVCALKIKALELIEDENIRVNILLSHNFYKEFLQHYNYYEHLLKIINLHLLLDSLEKVHPTFLSIICDFLIKINNKYLVIKFFNNNKACEKMGNYDIVINDKLKDLPYVDKIIGNSFFEKCLSSKKYAKILERKNYNSKTLGNLLKNYNISYIKKIMIINELHMSLKEKNKISYITFGKSINISLEVEKARKHIIKDYLSLEDTGYISNLIADIIENNIGYEYLEIVFKKLLENPDKTITKEYMEMFICNLFYEIANKEFNTNININIVSFLGKDRKIMGESDSLFRYITINSNLIKSSFAKTFYQSVNNNPLCIIFHELIHVNQFKSYTNNEIDYQVLSNLKDNLIDDELDDYTIYNKYYSLGNEMEANSKDVFYYFQYLENKGYLNYFIQGFGNNKVDYEKDILKKLNDIYKVSDDPLRHIKYTASDYYLINPDEKIKKVNTSRIMRIKKSSINSKNYSRNELFDETVNVKEQIDIYPILKVEYHIDGSKKSFDELFNEYLKYKNLFLNEKNNEYYLKMYQLYAYIINEYFKTEDFINKRRRKKKYSSEVNTEYEEKTYKRQK